MNARPPQASVALPSVAKLVAVRDQLAALRIQAEAIKVTPGVLGEMMTMPIFGWPVAAVETNSADRDVSRRDEKIVANLRERGPLRVLGALAGEALAERVASLYETHPNSRLATDYILGEEILARQSKGAIGGLRLLLHGGAGGGKTDFALTLAKHLAVPVEMVSLSSAQAAAYLAGSESFWSNSQPGIVWRLLVQGTHANPIIILDEIDKVSQNWGDPLGALYQLMEQRTAAAFCDKSVPWLPINAGMVNWVATANDLAALHPAIRSRFFEVEIGMPAEHVLIGLFQRLYTDLLTEFDVKNRFPSVLDQDVAQYLAKSSSIRESKGILRSALALALRQGAGGLRLPERNVPTAARTPMGFI